MRSNVDDIDAGFQCYKCGATVSEGCRCGEEVGDIKYYRQYVEDIRDDKPPTEITREDAIKALSCNYRNPDEVLDSTSVEHKVRTPFAFYWKGD